MAGPYCGKDCESCALREQLSCSGCRSGPGRTWGTECELARCCQQKGHESCQTCSFAAGCRLFSGRNEQPQYRFQERERSAQRQQEAAKKAEVLGKWLWILFWLMIVVQPVVGLMSDETVVGWFPQLYWPGQIASLLFLLADGAIFLKISEVELSYRTAGICQIVAGIVNFVVQLFTDVGMESGWLLLVLLPVIVVSLVGQYHCYMGHAAVLYKVDDTLAGKWGCFVEMEHRHVCTVLCQRFAGICPGIYRGADAAGRYHWNGGCHNSGTGVPVPDGPAVSLYCR